MTFKGPSQRELTKLVTNHVFRDIHRNMLFAVMHGHSEADEIGDAEILTLWQNEKKKSDLAPV